MAIDCPVNGKVTIRELVEEIDTKEDALGVGNPGQLLATNSAADGKEWVDAPNTGEWGQITGDINNQTDLMTELDTKVSKSGDTMTGPLELPYVVTPKTIAQGFTVQSGTNAIIGGFTIPDGETVTIEDGGSLIIV